MKMTSKSPFVFIITILLIAFCNTAIADELVVTEDGKVGIGFETPSGKLDVNGDIRAGNSDIYFTKADHNHTGIGNTPGYAAIENAANFGSLMILGRSGTPKGRYVRLWDYLQVNGGMDITGNVGIGTNTPAAMLHIRKDVSEGGEAMIASGIKLENPGITDPGLAGNANIFLGNYYVDFLAFHINGNSIFSMNELGDAALAGTLTENSDINLKEEIKPLERSLDKIAKLRGVNYKWKDKRKRGDKMQLGLIAQDVEKIFPEAVSEDTVGMKGIAYSRLIAPLIEAVKELKTENDELKMRLEALEKENKGRKL